MPNYPGWGFYKINPWRERFDYVIRKCIEAGLIDRWKFNTWVQMKEVHESENPDQQVVFTDDSKISALSLDDLQGLFYLGALALGFCTLVFITEFVVGKWKNIIN